MLKRYPDAFSAVAIYELNELLLNKNYYLLVWLLNEMFIARGIVKAMLYKPQAHRTTEFYSCSL